MNILVPSTPGRLRITATMMDDFLIDPLLGAKVIMNTELDAFQASRLRTYWWVPNVIDSSGVGTGKTSVGIFIFLNLRCCLIPDQHCAIYYQTFEAGKRNFWKHYRDPRFQRATIFQAQLGKVDLQGESDGKANSKGASCYYQYFKDDGVIMMPAPDWLKDAESHAGTDLNIAAIDEWTKSTNIGAKDSRDAKGNDGINKQILSRVRRGCYNQHHPIWCNRRLFMASAESPSHPAYQRYRQFEQQVRRGNPKFALLSYSYKDWSNRKCWTGKTFKEQLRDEGTYEALKVQLTRAEFKRQALGIWAKETKGWYSEEALVRCVDLGQRLGLDPITAISEWEALAE